MGNDGGCIDHGCLWARPPSGTGCSRSRDSSQVCQAAVKGGSALSPNASPGPSVRDRGGWEGTRTNAWWPAGYPGYGKSSAVAAWSPAKWQQRKSRPVFALAWAWASRRTTENVCTGSFFHRFNVDALFSFFLVPPSSGDANFQVWNRTNIRDSHGTSNSISHLGPA